MTDEEEKYTTYKISVPIINNEELERIMNDYNNMIDEIINCALHDKELLIAQELMKKQKKELEKKDKIINLMAERLTTPINSKEWVIDYYKRKVEDK